MSLDPLRDRFEAIDADANGKIDEPELGKLLDALGVGYSAAQVHAAFTSIDVDGSGVIELEEFRLVDDPLSYLVAVPGPELPVILPLLGPPSDWSA